MNTFHLNNIGTSLSKIKKKTVFQMLRYWFTAKSLVSVIKSCHWTARKAKWSENLTASTDSHLHQLNFSDLHIWALTKGEILN